jgi:hypothetical protein
MLYCGTNAMCGALGSYLPFQKWFNERRYKVRPLTPLLSSTDNPECQNCLLPLFEFCNDRTDGPAFLPTWLRERIKVRR